MSSQVCIDSAFARLASSISIVGATTWAALIFPLPGGCSLKGRNFNEYALALSTAMAGLGALWTWLVAPSKHILWASYFLFLNWFEGFITFYLILLIRCDSSSHNLSLDFLYKVFFFRTALLACEMVCLQALVENRLKSLWHVPSHSNCFDTFLFAAETSTLCFGIIAMILQLLFPLDLGLWWVQLLLLSCAFVVPMGFVAWAVQVLLRLCCCLMVLAFFSQVLLFSFVFICFSFSFSNSTTGVTMSNPHRLPQSPGD